MAADFTAYFIVDTILTVGPHCHAALTKWKTKGHSRRDEKTAEQWDCKIQDQCTSESVNKATVLYFQAGQADD